MQSRALLITLALLVAPAASTSAATARAFLRSHVKQAPSGDELAELKGENPEAYALVKALLTKRSLGLLDPKHPNSKFSGAAPVAQQQEEAPEEAGPEVYEQFASPAAHAPLAAVSTHSKVALPYAEVNAAPAHDWMNWKPADAAQSDEQMVQNVLGAVAGMVKGKKSGLLSKNRNTEENTLTAEAAEPAEVAPAPQRAAAPVEEPTPVAPVEAPKPAPRENSYLKTVDLGVSSQEQPAAPAPKKNSYLDGIDLTGDMPTVTGSTESAKKTTSQVEKSSTNYLSGFSWNSDSDEQERPQRQAAPVRQELPKAAQQSSTLLSWLGVVNKEPQPQVVQQAAAAKPSNPYLADLS